MRSPVSIAIAAPGSSGSNVFTIIPFDLEVCIEDAREIVESDGRSGGGDGGDEGSGVAGIVRRSCHENVDGEGRF